MRRLLERRFDVRVWNRTPDKLAPLLDAGARAVASPVDLVRDADFVLTCLTDGAAVEGTGPRSREAGSPPGRKLPRAMGGEFYDRKIARFNPEGRISRDLYP